MSRENSTAKLGISLGDPAGIGPEIVARAISELSPARQKRLLIFGDAEILDWATQLQALPALADLNFASSPIDCSDFSPGIPNDFSAAAQVRYLEEAVAAAKSEKIKALVTAPINKAEAQRAGFSFPGHTEFLASRLGAKRVAMFFAGPKLKVALATVHHGIAKLPQVLTRQAVSDAIELAAHSLRNDFAIANPRIGILGLNPHAGEQGKFGKEEEEIIKPAMEEARVLLGNTVELLGPLVPDAAFRMPLDCFVAMYHDQGLIPVKLLDFEQSVNMSLGLPILRTSPDHGTAYDIAGKGIARHTSFACALELGFELLDKGSRGQLSRG